MSDTVHADFTIRLIREFDDHEPVVLGQVRTTPSIVGLVKTNMALQEAKDVIQGAWERFRDSKPECDTDFLKFLLNEGDFYAVEDNAHDVVLS